MGCFGRWRRTGCRRCAVRRGAHPRCPGWRRRGRRVSAAPRSTPRRRQPRDTFPLRTRRGAHRRVCHSPPRPRRIPCRPECAWCSNTSKPTNERASRSTRRTNGCAKKKKRLSAVPWPPEPAGIVGQRAFGGGTPGLPPAGRPPVTSAVRPACSERPRIPTATRSGSESPRIAVGRARAPAAEPRVRRRLPARPFGAGVWPRGRRLESAGLISSTNGRGGRG